MYIQLSTLSEADEFLVQQATEMIVSHYSYGRHHIAAAMRTKDGRILTALHLDTVVRRAAICAEAIVLGIAISNGFTELDTIVAVRHRRPDENGSLVSVVSPCGICRELLVEYAPNLNVIVSQGDRLYTCQVSTLLPIRFSHN